jgi:hypothetical protein
VFYLQARQEDQVVSLKLEKEQVLFLAGGLTEVLADLASPPAVPTEGDLELEEPVLAEWAVGSLQLAYDQKADRIVLVARELGAPSGTAGGGLGALLSEMTGLAFPSTGSTGAERSRSEQSSGVARVVLTRGQAVGVVEHGKRLLRTGRPPCPLCGYPLGGDPLGGDHSCPKTNGRRSPSL